MKLNVKVISKEGNDLTWYNINGKMHNIMHNVNEIIKIILITLREYNYVLKKKRKQLTVQIMTIGVTEIIIVIVKIV